MKFKGLILLTLVGLLTLPSCGKKENNQHKEDEISYVNIISVSDLHGALLEDSKSKGIAKLKADIDAIENEDDVKNTIVIGNGDMFQGTPLSNLTMGESVINAMNACNFDVIGIGNHEFDWGIEKVTSYFDGDSSNGESTAKLVNSNIYKNNQLLEHTVPYSVIDLGFVKVGVVSYAPHDLKSSILKSRTEGYDFRIVDTMNSVIQDCKEECDIVVANMHWGKNIYDPYNYKLIDYGVDAIINGHVHTSYSGLLPGKEIDSAMVPVVETKDQLKKDFGHIKLTIKNKKVIDSSVENVYVGSKGNKKDPTVEAVVNEEYEKVSPIINEQLCTTVGNQSKSQYQTWAPILMQQVIDTDIALINNGAIRNINFKSGDNITFGDCYDIMPFDNAVYIFHMTGEELNKFYYDDASYAYRDSSIKMGKLENGHVYSIAIIDYVALKYRSLKAMVDSGEAQTYPVIFRDMIVNEFRAHGEQNIPFNPTNDILTKKIK